MAYYERKLPHWHPQGAALFVTFRLHGSLPKEALEAMPGLSPGRAFVHLDHHLDAARSGPLWLKDPRLARLVAETLHDAQNELKLGELRAWVVMANHVHVVLFPQAPLDRIMKSIKGFTGHRANQILGRKGTPFWQQESYDHWIRNRDEMERIVPYVEGNPVRAGLVSRVEDWPWSSAAG